MSDVSFSVDLSEIYLAVEDKIYEYKSAEKTRYTSVDIFNALAIKCIEEILPRHAYGFELSLPDYRPLKLLDDQEDLLCDIKDRLVGLVHSKYNPDVSNSDYVRYKYDNGFLLIICEEVVCE